MKIKIILGIALLTLALACGKKSPPAPEPTPPAPPVVPPPANGTTTKATLLLPTKNEVCYAGVVQSSTASKVTFKWTEGQSVESYTITVKNLNTGNSFIQTPLITNQTEMSLERNTPYSWFVQTKSKNNNGEVFESEVWKFYNAGEGITRYAPYPAELISPTKKQSIASSAGKITLSWRTDDPDGNVVNYDIYLGTTTTPALILSKSGSNTYPATVSSGVKYYWKIVSRDSYGYTSESDMYEFTVL
ncbi:hypothetical protein SRABI27_04645 [Pedobacter sp. Bi27]|uniref:hypothetical protein n=1 Tax=unclassified Pedobacter TaxID=2628915 RepID=UPI001D520572|nr:MULTISPECIES: hypothetical protein [unclassified Pedobacter]CAH0197708.1 hypothetical protein SRABI36_01915 [Pedobacter sp. Bi36]CAH0253295.1 hypothetical protein SRABI126_03010 [Pedobacter sp. Bi126]CAH0307782.1 hypothetical protein SRABI27_04645 [Pedobacter sp. Bi27]